MTFSHLDHDNKVTTKLCWPQEHLHNKYNRYAALFYTCETSNLLIVISQILVINKFLNYQFLSYGFNVSLDIQISVVALYKYLFRFGPGTLCRQRRELCRIWIRCVRCSQGLPAVTMSGNHRQLPSSKSQNVISSDLERVDTRRGRMRCASSGWTWSMTRSSLSSGE